MSKFCTSCGAKSDEDVARFCDACGASFSTTIKPPVNPSAPTLNTTIATAKIVKIAGIAVLVLMILIGVIWFFTKLASPPDAGALSAILNEDKVFADDKTCLTGLQYDKKTISVLGYDSVSKQWMDALVSAGLYGAPEKTGSAGWFSSAKYEYTQTPLGLKAVRNGQLCFANGIVVDSVNYAEPRVVNNTHLLKGHYSYHYSGLEKWASLPALVKLAPNILAKTQFEEDVFLSANQHAWRIARGSDKKTARELAKLDEAKTELATPVTNTGGLFAWFGNLFTGVNANPLIGKWIGVDSGVAIEFTATDMIEGRHIVPVTYQMQDKAVVVSGAAHEDLTFDIVDADHILMDARFLKITLTRVN
ncbi:MAG: hypothetical protein HOP20_08780 [Sulfuriferula sp.]|nr:hypothetical protein [Sulfuriferula sp.]